MRFLILILCAGCFSASSPLLSSTDGDVDADAGVTIPDAMVDAMADASFDTAVDTAVPDGGCIDGIRVIEANRVLDAVSARVAPRGSYLWGQLQFAMENHYYWHDTYEVGLRFMDVDEGFGGHVVTWTDEVSQYSNDWEESTRHAIALGESYSGDGSLMVMAAVDEGREMGAVGPGIVWRTFVGESALESEFVPVAPNLEILSLDGSFHQWHALLRNRDTGRHSVLSGDYGPSEPVEHNIHESIFEGTDYRLIAGASGPIVTRITNVDWPPTVTVAMPVEPGLWLDEHFVPGCGVTSYDTELASDGSIPTTDELGTVALCDRAIQMVRYSREEFRAPITVTMVDDIRAWGVTPQIGLSADATTVAWWDPADDHATVRMFDPEGVPLTMAVPLPAADHLGDVAHMELTTDGTEWALLVVRREHERHGPVAHLTRFELACE